VTGHLIHIGYAKTGSSYLRRWFASHPQLEYADAAIAGFPSVHDISRQAVAARPGLLFRVTSSEGLATPHVRVGDPLGDFESVASRPRPEAQAEACATLASLFPRAHVLLVTRGFRSIWFSGYSEFIRGGGDPAELERRAEADRREADAWNYDRIIGLYRHAFGDRLIVMPYEMLRDDPGGFARELERRLGLDHHPPPRERVNRALEAAELSWYPRLTRVVRALPVGMGLRRRLFGLYVRAIRANRLHGPVRLLQAIRPLPPVTADGITDDMLERFRGTAESLRGDPLYAPYAKDYLL